MDLPLFPKASLAPIVVSNPDYFSEADDTCPWTSRRAESHPVPGLGADMELLITALQVDLVELLKTEIATGWSSPNTASEFSTIYYCSSGWGQMVFAQSPPVNLNPHTLVIVPPNQRARVIAHPWEETSRDRLPHAQRPMQARPTTVQLAGTNRLKPTLELFVGRFRASYCASIDLFATVPRPIAEQFDLSDQVEARLQSAIGEMHAQEIGTQAMAATLLKQVLVTLFRRFQRSPELWQERFSLISDPQIARAFGKMVGRPGASHTIQSLSMTAALGRSTFMARFHKAVGCTPMLALRQLRMKQALELFESGIFSVDQVANRVGYASRSSFMRAFRQSVGKEPAECRRQVSFTRA